MSNRQHRIGRLNTDDVGAKPVCKSGRVATRPTPKVQDMPDLVPRDRTGDRVLPEILCRLGVAASSVVDVGDRCSVIVHFSLVLRASKSKVSNAKYNPCGCLPEVYL